MSQESSFAHELRQFSSSYLLLNLAQFCTIKHILAFHNLLTDCVTWHSIVSSAAQVHPPIIFILRVNRKTVLVAVLVGLSCSPVIVRPRCSRHPSPNTLLMQVNAPNPPGVLYVSSVGDGQVSVDLCGLFFALGLGKVATLKVATSQGIEPVHSIVEVTSTLIVVLDQHVAFPRPLNSRQPAVVSVTTGSGACIPCQSRDSRSSQRP